MKAMKVVVPEITSALKKRTRKEAAVGKIDQEDADFIVGHLEEIEARVVLMREQGYERREF